MKQKGLKKKTILDKMTKDELAKWLYDIAAQKNLVVKAVSKFKTHSQLSMVLDKEGVSSELNLTIASVIDRISRYSQTLKNPYKNKTVEFKAYQEGFNQYEESIPSKYKTEALIQAYKLGQQQAEIWHDKLRLEQPNDVEGYFISSFFNNVLKVYSDYQTDKRKCDRVIFFEDYSKDGNDNKRSQNKMMSYLSVSPEKEKNFNSTLVEIALFLKKEDSKRNTVSEKQNKSQLSKLFLAIVNQKKNMTNEEIRSEFDWSPYLLRKNKEELIDKVKAQFADRREEIIQFLDDREVIGK